MKKSVIAVIVFVIAAGAVLPLTSSADMETPDGTLSLPDAVDRAMQRSPAMEMAEVRKDRTRLQWRQAQDTAEMIEEYDSALASLYSRQARTSYRIARAEVDATEEDLTLQVQLAYRTVQVMETLRQPTQSALRVAREAMRTAQSMYEEDLINRGQLLEAEEQMEAARSMADDILGQQEKARRDLKQMLDYDEYRQIELTEAPPRFQPVEVESLDAKVQQALQNRFEMTEIEETIALAEYRLEVVQESDLDPDAPEFIWLIELIGPDDDAAGGGGEYAEDIAQLELREAKLGKKIMQGQIESEVRNLYRDIRTQQQVVREKRVAYNLADEQYRRSQHMYREDMVSRLRLLSSYIGRLQADAQYMVQQYNHEMRKLRFHHSYGVGSSVDTGR